MKFQYSIHEICRITQGELLGDTDDRMLQSIYFDSRLFETGHDALFLCLNGKRKGTEFIPAAYAKRCRVFLIQKGEVLPELTETTFIIVSDVLSALQTLAQNHRLKFNFPVVGITGSFGKTIIKEWLNHFLKDHFHVIRSPKSYNSQMGVALSVLQMRSEHNIALFEAGISTQNEMRQLQKMIQPSLGIFTGLGSAHDDGFSSREDKFQEKSILFESCSKVVSENFSFPKTENSHWQDIQVEFVNHKILLHVPNYGTFQAPFSEKHKIHNLRAVLQTLKELNYPAHQVQSKLESLPQIAMRMEVIQGKNENLIVNDSYALDSFPEALAFLNDSAQKRKKYVFVGLTETNTDTAKFHQEIAQNLTETEVYFISDYTVDASVLTFEDAQKMLAKIQNSAILFKGQHGSGIAKLIAPLVSRTHPTILEISRKALRNNLTQFKKHIQPKTKLMVMVKAAAYGVGAYEMAHFLEKEGVDYLGVAFPDEGVNLRKMGVQLPIMVMNTHEDAFYDVIQHNLEPAIFSVQQLDNFTAELIRSGRAKYPVHLKIETGMNRLGFREEDLNDLANFLSSQPEIEVKSVYSHLAESGNSNKDFTNLQIERFENALNKLKNVISPEVVKHICNTDGIINYPEAHFDMVRLGIGLLGYAKLPGLESVLSMRTRISKINSIQKGESLGYDRSFVAQKEMKIAVLPIGYADGFHRSFGKNRGFVSIDNQKCEILGNVCMDMCFADVSHVNCQVNDEVELIGAHVGIQDWASWSQTIPYEVITSLSLRLNRIWTEE